MKFPNDFLWGASTAAYQVEGAVNEDGKGKTAWDKILHENKNITFENANGDVAADHYHKFREDIKLMVELGLNAYRFSIAWARIMPKGDKTVNPKGVAFYHELIDELIKNKITPVVTMHHFDTPLAFDERVKDWSLSKEFDESFLAFAKVLFDEYGSKVKHWIIFNEPNIMAMMCYKTGMLPPHHTSRKGYYAALHKQATVHAKTIEMFHAKKMKGIIGSSIATQWSIPASNSKDDIEAEKYYKLTEYEFINDIFGGKGYSKEFLAAAKADGFLPANYSDADNELIKKHKPTFFGINYYSTYAIAKDKGVNKGDEVVWDQNNSGQKNVSVRYAVPGKWTTAEYAAFEKTDWGWPIYPAGLTEILLDIEAKYKLPTIISENGLGYKDVLTADQKVHDDYRIDYLKKHLEACQTAINKGAKLISFCPWSFVDLFSWVNGYQKRYGLVYVNRTEHDLKDLKRIKKDSFYWYQDLIKQNKK